MTAPVADGMFAFQLLVYLTYALATHGLIETTRRFLLSKPPGTRMVGAAWTQGMAQYGGPFTKPPLF